MVAHAHRLTLAAQLRQRRRHVQVRGRAAEDGDAGGGGGGADRVGLAPPADAERAAPPPPAAAARGPVRAGKTPRTCHGKVGTQHRNNAKVTNEPLFSLVFSSFLWFWEAAGGRPNRRFSHKVQWGNLMHVDLSLS